MEDKNKFHVYVYIT